MPVSKQAFRTFLDPGKCGNILPIIISDMCILLKKHWGISVCTSYNACVIYQTSSNLFTSQYLYAVMREVTALVPVQWESMYALAIYTAERTRQRWPILLTTESQQDMESWVIQPQCQNK